MTVKKNSNTTRTTNATRTTKKTKNDKKIGKEIEKKEKSDLQKNLILQQSIKIANEDRVLKKVEKYVNKNREKTSKEIAERKSKRPIKQYQEWDLEVMISRISAESKPTKETKEISKKLLYIIYTAIFIIILIFLMKYFFIWSSPQIS